MVKIGVIGVGNFGRNYLKVFDNLENADVKWICSTDNNSLNGALKQIKEKSKVKSTTNYKDILKDKDVDAVAIVTPGSTHYKFAKEALNSDKHVIVEKPPGFTSKDVRELLKISDEHKKKFMVSYLHCFNPGIQKIRDDFKSGLFGKINYIQSLHFGNGPVRDDMSALWDFFSHTASILLFLLDELPKRVNANGASFLKKGIEDVVSMDLKYSSNVFATASASWLYPKKRMELEIAAEKLYASFDDYAKDNKLKYFDPGLNDKSEMKFTSPKIQELRPLTEQLRHFVDCVQDNKEPLTGGKFAVNVTRVLESAQESLSKGGRFVDIGK